MIVDYFSKFPEVIKMINHIMFNYWGNEICICMVWKETLVSDNGPQYISAEFSEFSVSYNSGYIMSSPYFVQSNG